MCGLCSDNPSERSRAKEYHLEIATQLNDLARDYRNFAQDVIKPHTDEAKLVSLRAMNIIRHLVDDWL